MQSQPAAGESSPNAPQFGGAQEPFASSADQAAREPGPAIHEHELVRRVGRGAYGEVWLARNALGTCRAIKIVYRKDFEDSRPFEREFEGIQKFEPISRSHPGLVHILQVGRREDYFYYVMELADAAEAPKPEIRNPKEGRNSKSESVAASDDTRDSTRALPSAFDLRPSDLYRPRTLREDLRQNGRLPAARCVEIGIALTSALSHLHRQGLVHRDVKPSNIIFVQSAPKLADIGLVTEAGDSRSIVGTEGYLPPEGPGTPQADIFSLGKVLYEISTGQDRGQFPELPPDLRGWPDARLVFELNEAILKACAADTRERYQSAEEMHGELALLQRGQSIRRRRVAAQRLAQTAKLVLATALLVLFGAAVLAIKSEMRRGEAPRKSSITTFETSGTRSREAYNAYNIGRFYWNKRTGEGLSNAIVRFEDAIRLDPRFARAYAGLSDAYNLLHGYAGVSHEVTLPQARAAVLRALELDPSLAEVHTSLAKFKFDQEWDWAGAEHEFRRALMLDTNYALAHFWYGNYLAAMGRAEEAVRENRRAVELEPTCLVFNNILGLNLLYARNYEGAIEQLRQTVAMDPFSASVRLDLAVAYELQGRYDAAVAEWEKCSQLFGESAENLLVRRAAFQAGDIRAYWQKEKEQLKERIGREPALAIHLARVCTFLGETDESFVWLGRAYVQHDDYLKYVTVDPTFDPLRSDPRFHGILKDMRLE